MILGIRFPYDVTVLLEPWQWARVDRSLVKQLLNKTYDIDMPGVVGVYLTGEPMKGVGPQDIALAIIGEVFDKWLCQE